MKKILINNSKFCQEKRHLINLGSQGRGDKMPFHRVACFNSPPFPSSCGLPDERFPSGTWPGGWKAVMTRKTRWPRKYKLKSWLDKGCVCYTVVFSMPDNKTFPDIFRGWLLKWTNYIKGYQKRWFVLSNGLLSYYRYSTRNILFDYCLVLPKPEAIFDRSLILLFVVNLEIKPRLLTPAEEQ